MAHNVYYQKNFAKWHIRFTIKQFLPNDTAGTLSTMCIISKKVPNGIKRV
jgi:hypothetical protein